LADTQQMLGHLGINVPDLAAAKHYYDALMPLVGFETFFATDDEFSYRPAGYKPGTFLFFYPAAGGSVIHAPQHFPQYPGHYYAMFWLDPFGIKLEAVCHHDRD
jgi:catechol 2,3-dioxygenase-like lactoylglutathione lyase family enzyme